MSYTTSGPGTSGAYSVTISGGGTGCAATSTVSASYTMANQPSLSSLTSSSSNPFCSGSVITLTVTTTGGAGTPTYTWSGPGIASATGTSSGTLSSYTTSGAGTTGAYSVTISGGGTGCATTSTVSPSYTMTDQPSLSGLSSSSSNPFCTGGVITLTVTTTGGAGTPTYTWSGPGIPTTTSTSAGTLSAYATSGTATSGMYSVTMSGGGTGCAATSTVSATTYNMNSQPAIGVVTSSPSNTNICTGGSITLIATPSGGAGTASYIWSGPGITATASATNTSPTLSPSVISTTTGAYSVALSYDGTGCATAYSITASVYTVSPQPTVASITPSASALCIGTPLTLTAGSVSGPGAVTYNWSGPNGYSDIGSVNTSVFTPSVTAAGGIYSLTVSYSGTGCVSAQVTTNVIVDALPTLAAITPSTPALCYGSTVLTLTEGSSPTMPSRGTNTFTWRDPSGGTRASGTLNAGDTYTVTPNSSSYSGVYTLTAVYSEPGCSSTQVTTTVTVDAQPVLAAITPSDSKLCFGATVLTLTEGSTPTAPATGTNTYTWSGPAGVITTTGSISAGASATVTPSGTSYSGVYSLSATYSETGCTSAPVTTNVRVDAQPTLASITSSTPALCFGSASFILTEGTSPTSPTGISDVYTWSGPAGVVTTASSLFAGSQALVIPTSTGFSGAYTLSATYGETGCASTPVTVNVIVDAQPVLAAITSSTPALCFGSTVLTLTEGSSPTAPSTGTNVYTWSSPVSAIATTGTISGGSTATVTPTSTGFSGVYALSVTYSETGCTSATVTTNVIVNAQPALAAITPSTPALCFGSTVLTLTEGSSPASPATGTNTFTWSGPAGVIATTGSLISGSHASTTPSDLTYNGIYSLTGTYTQTGCLSTQVTTNVIVDAQPVLAGITSSTPALCFGSTVLTLTEGEAPTAPTTGANTYRWSSPAGLISTVGTLSAGSTATVTPSSTAYSGVYTLSVTYAETGCTSTPVTTTVTVNAQPTLAAITPSSPSICFGPTVLTLTEGTSPTSPASGTNSFTWSGPAGVITTTGSIAAGSSASITPTGLSYSGVYTLSGTYSQTGCANTQVTTNVNVYAVPTTAASNNSPACAGNSVLLNANATSTSGTLSYLWNGPLSYTSSLGAPTLSSVTVTESGTYTVTVTTPGAGCIASSTTTVTVNPLPSGIHGTNFMCVGNVSSLSNDVTTGTWASSNSNATVDGSGNVTGVTAGTSVITYNVPGGCYITTIVTVNPLPFVVLGPNSVCTGSTVSLSDLTTGGTWASDNGTVASVGSSSGIVTGNIQGTYNIVYTLPTGCARSYAMTVNPITAITNNSVVCAGSSFTLSDATSGGTWISSTPTKATVGSSSGLVTGVAGGTSTVTYLVSATGCSATAVVTVSTNTAISGTPVVCMNATTALSNVTTGGTWSVVGSAVTVGTSGIVSGVSAGTSTVSYALGSGCASSVVVTVNPITPIQTTPATVCVGFTTQLTDATAGGTWSSSASSNASIDGSGNVSGLVAGTSNITYLISATGCKATAVLTVNPITSILGATSVCTGATVNLSDATTGGSWSASGSATVGTGTGVVTGVSAGTAVISYTLPTGCAAGVIITVNQTPTISGPATACIGSSFTLSDIISGGTWSSSNPTAATIGSTGLVTGMATGTSTIGYVISSGCAATSVMSVYAIPAAISGASAVCNTFTISLSDATTGGTWSVDANATVDGAGIVTGTSPGIANVTYNVHGCTVSTPITVTSSPSALSASALCAGSSITFTNSAPGGVWTSSSTSVATIGSSSGVFNGVSGGVTTVSYVIGSGCSVSTTMTVNAIQPITGSLGVCVNGTSQLSDASTGGTWTSSGGVITLGSAGLVTAGSSTGTATVTYTLGTGCSRVVTVSVVTAPPALSGPTTVCQAYPVTLSDGISGGVWSSSNSILASVSSTGVVTGSTTLTGSATISYSFGSCVVTQVENVTANPGFISGNTSECVGLVTTLSDPTAGGTWSSSNSNATVDGSGHVTGVTGGASTISYFVNGCFATYPNTVKTSPTPMYGASFSTCVGGVIYVYDSTGVSMSYTSGNASVASVVNSGAITGNSAGTTLITYTINTGCYTTQAVTVFAATASISGNSSVLCPSYTMSLSDVTGAGTWHSGSTGVATVDGSGNVTGVGGGTSIISYSPVGTSGCQVTTVVTVNAASPITGTMAVCAGSSTALHNLYNGGVWSSPSSNVSVNGSTGVVTGLLPGTATVYYNTTGCSVNTVVTVNATATLSGNTPVCTGNSIALGASVGGGTWSGGGTIASVDGSGNVSGLLAGNATISYLLADGCLSTTVATVNSMPAAISTVGSVCQGLSTTLSDAVTGGVWSTASSNINLGTSTGVVTGVTTGTATVAYTIASICSVSTVITVNVVPSAISGTFGLCAGTSTTLTATPASGTWTSNNAHVSIDATSGVATAAIGDIGSSLITYTLPDGCTSTATVNVSILPSAISGNLTTCPGATTSLSDIPTGGTWSTVASDISIGTSTGVVTGISAGTALISYGVGVGCYVSAIVTVNPLPAAISGSNILCAGTSITLSDVTPAGGTWSGNNNLIANVGSATGVVNATSTAGTVIVTYTAPTGCMITSTVTVSPLPAFVTGPYTECIGAFVTLSDATTGGTWSGTNSYISVNGTSGQVTGLSAGNTSVTYTAPGTGCIVTYPMAVNVNPTPIFGTFVVCTGAVAYVYDTSGVSSSYSSSNTSVATVINSGAVTGVMAGTSIITYTNSIGCIATQVVTVNSPTSGLTGNTGAICPGFTLTLTDAAGAGTWATSNASVATVGSTGVVSGIAGGTATITYTPIGTSGCQTTTVITINPAPSITGPGNVCDNGTIALSDIVTGGTWSTLSAHASVIGSTGLVSGVSAGTALISYTTPGTCVLTTLVTINVSPASILGTLSVCVNGVTSLSDNTSPGTWSSSIVANGSVDGSGNVQGINAGTTTITYTAAGCFNTAIVTVNPLPTSILGPNAICQGATFTISDATALGNWTSSSASATIDGTTGSVHGVSAGTSTISYKLPTGCAVSIVMTVNPISPILNNFPVCANATITMGDATGSGTWTSGTSVASIGSSSGIVSGITGGTGTITYQVTATGCFATAVITVNPIVAITGPMVVCSGSSISLSDATPGGAWTASGAASIDASTGTLTAGASAGTSTVSYTIASTSCASGVVVTVNQTPAISGSNVVCVGSQISLTANVGSGTWSSSNGNATVDASGHVTGVSAGSAAISYVSPSGCVGVQVVAINPIPVPISGNNVVCIGYSILLSDTSSAGTWAVDVHASIDGSGNLSGLTAGTATVSYSFATGCRVTKSVVVSGTPSVITPVAVCAGSGVTLSDSPTGGTWSTSNTAIGTIDPASGAFGGIAGGTVTVTYTIASGCTATTTMTVNTILPINGATSVCIGGSTTLTDASTGGTWTTSSGIITIGSATGVIHGLSGGTASVMYTLPTGCSRTVIITVNSAADPILGNLAMCISSTSTLSDDGGGTWSGANVYASVNSSGVVTSSTYIGTTTITYTLGSGCISTAVVTVNANPAFVTGPYNVCVNASVTLSDASTGGTWSANNSNISVDGSGNVTGLVIGTSLVSYKMPAGCYVTYPMTVNKNPTAIYGATFAICPGAVTYVYDTTATSMSYTSSNPSVATVINSGAVTGVTAGTTMITYTINTGCIATQVMTVNPLPDAITGNAPVCAGMTQSLTDDIAGGTWSTSNSAIALVGSTGIVTAVAGGTATITYVASTGCKTTTTVTVNPILPINGAASILCGGATITLSDATTGGTWATSDNTIATVGSSTGVVTGVGSGGVVNITYLLGSGCSRTVTLTVNATPSPITGPSSIACEGYTLALTDAATGGAWSSNSTLVATVSSAGVVTGSATRSGALLISYTIAGCAATYPITVNPNPAFITGTNAECVGATVLLSDATVGGTWSTSSTNVTVDGSGNVTGSVAGSYTISYTVNNCFSTYPMSVRPNPVAMTGTFSLCMGTTAYVYDASTVSQSYKSSNTSVATVINSGAITPVSAGTSTITYTINTGCYTTQVITVSAMPVVSAISGPPSISHTGGSIILSDATSGGTWLSSNSAVISLSGAGIGSVTATAAASSGNATISYTVVNGACTARVTKTITATARYSGGSTTGNVTTVYTGSTVSIIDDVLTGAWTSSDNGIATVDSTGAVYGIKPGTVNITHVMGNDQGGLTTIVTPVIVTPVPASLSLLPNPNKGTFTVKGTLGSMDDEEVTLEVTDVLGQVLYKEKVTAHAGKINETITISNTLANGMYMLNLRSNTEKMVFHFVLEQ